MQAPSLHVTPSPLLPTNEAPLPVGVTRCPQASPQATLADCEAVMITFAASEQQGTIGYVVWREPVEGAVKIRPISKHRITELRPGDQADVAGDLLTVVGVEVWR